MSEVGARIKRTLGANALGQVLQVVVQLGVVPIYLRAWGVDRYADWLLLSTIPAYLAASDLGFISAASNAMSAARARGDEQGALRNYQTAWGLATGFSSLFTIAVILGALVFPPANWLGIRTLSPGQVFQCVCLLAVYAAVSQQESVVQAGFRAEGRNASGILSTNLIRFASMFATAVYVSVFHATPVAAACVLLVSRLAGLLWQVVHLRSFAPYLRLSLRGASTAEMRKLLRPSLAFLGLPLGNLITLQGFILVLGQTASSASLVAFSLVRTLSRFGTQMIGIIEVSVWPEISFAYGRQDIRLLRSLHHRACAVTFYMSVLAAMGLVLFGQSATEIWTAGRVHPSISVVELLALDLVLTALWSTSAVLPAATNNRLARVTTAYVICGGISLCLCQILSARLGSLGAPLAMIACDVLMVPIVLSNSLSQLQETLSRFLSYFRPMEVLTVTRKRSRHTVGPLQ